MSCDLHSIQYAMFGLSNLIFKNSNIFFQVVLDLTVTELYNLSDTY